MEIQTLPHFSEPVHVAVLPNGFTLIHIERKSELVYAEIVIAAGSADDIVEGEAHFLEHLIQGGRHRGGSHPLFAAFSNKYGIMDSNGETSPFSMSYYGRVWKKNALEFIRVLGEMITRPDVSDKAVKGEIGPIQSEIKTKQEARRAREAFLNEIIPSRRDVTHNPLGTHETVAGMTSETLLSYHRRLFTKPRCLLLTMGSLDIRAISETFAEYIDRLPDDTHDARNRTVTYKPERTGYRTIQSKRSQSIELDFINRGPAIGKDWLLFSIANSFLFNPEHGSLYDKLRLKHGLIYGISRDNQAWPVHYSCISVDGIPEAHVDGIREMIIADMSAVDLDFFDRHRLGRIKRGIALHEARTREKNVSPNDIIYGWLRNDFKHESLEEYLAFVDRITTADLLEAHRKHWDPDHLLIIRTEPA